VVVTGQLTLSPGAKVKVQQPAVTPEAETQARGEEQ
jgi:hypothetical protein